MGIILASGSPRRRELLTLAGIEFKVVKSDTEEILPDGISPDEAVRLLAKEKALDVLKQYPDEIILAADTVVAVDGKILVKPKDSEDAFSMLQMLSGRVHGVYTGVCIMSRDKTDLFTEMTEVEFYPLTDSEIHEYVETGEPMDKAGAYGIQGKGSLLVKSIKGDYFNVVGLPLAKTVRELRNFTQK
ncbi:MAG: Maf family protein [Clostridiales bacterium]|nr:Maf family protein [Clostridiales bacterium]